MTDQTDRVDFALAAYREEGEWQLQEIAKPMVEDIDTVATALRRFPGDGGALGLIAVDEDFCLIIRVAGHITRVLLSDVTAAEEWEIANSALEQMGIVWDEDEDEPTPAGDLEIVADLGLSAMDLGVLLDDDELYPDELLSEVAAKLGFGDMFDDAVGLANA